LHEDGNTAVRAAVFDNGDGTYRASYTALKAGQYTVVATLGRTTDSAQASIEMLYDGAVDRPMLSVVHATLHAPSTTAIGDGLHGSISGETARFVVEARDSFGNLINGDGVGDGESAGLIATLYAPNST